MWLYARPENQTARRKPGGGIPMMEEKWWGVGGWGFEAAARRYIIFVSIREEMAHAQLYNGSASFRGKPLEKFSPTINENILFLFLAAIKSTHELQNNNIIYICGYIFIIINMILSIIKRTGIWYLYI